MNKYIFNHKLNNSAGILCLFTLLCLMLLGQQGELYRYLDIVSHQNEHAHFSTSVNFHNQQHLVMVHSNQHIEKLQHSQVHHEQFHSKHYQINHSEEEQHQEQHEYHIQSTDIDALIAINDFMRLLDYVLIKSSFYKFFPVNHSETNILQIRPPPWTYQILMLIKSIILLI